MKFTVYIQVLIGACIAAAAVALKGDEIILWQHLEGSSYNKGVAVYNRGDEDVDLAANKYALWVAHNGKPLEESIKINFQQGLIVKPKQYAMICSESASFDLKDYCNQTTSAGTLMNKDDVVSLMIDQTQYDVIGDFNSPGPWDVNGVKAASQDHTLVRKLKSPVATTDWSLAETQYIVLDKNILQTLDGKTHNIGGGGSAPSGGKSPSGPPGSCKGQCAETLSSDGSCYCNPLCTKFNDCCDDYHKQCDNAKASCQDRCGDKGSDGKCWCNTQCKSYEDCCPDYEDACGPFGPPDQCSGACSGSSPDGSCFCNSYCTSYNDCCSDHDPGNCNSPSGGGSPSCSGNDCCGGPCECPSVPLKEELKNNMIQKNILSIGTYNAEWLFDGEHGPSISPWKSDTNCPSGDANPALPCSVDGALQHMKDVAAEIDKLDVDILNVVEVESCQVLKTVAGYITDKDYNVYLKQGEDTYTGQNVGMLTLIDPVTDLQRTEDRQSYPLSSSKCGYSGSSSDTGVSKHYYTTFEIGDATITWIGVHFLSNPTSEEKCAKREAQALIIQGLIKDALALDYEVVVLGDMNDWTSNPGDIDSANSKPISQVLPKILQDVDGDGVNDLFSAASLLPQSERYTEEYNNGATMLDHVLMTPALHNIISSVEIDHSIKPYQISDHWPVIVRFNLEPPLISAPPSPPTSPSAPSTPSAPLTPSGSSLFDDVAILWQLIRGNSGEIGIAILNLRSISIQPSALGYSLRVTTGGKGWDSAEHIEYPTDATIPSGDFFVVCSDNTTKAFLNICDHTTEFQTDITGNVVIGLVADDEITDAIGDVQSSSPWGVKDTPNAGLNNTVVRDLDNIVFTDDADNWENLNEQYIAHPANTFVGLDGTEIYIPLSQGLINGSASDPVGTPPSGTPPSSKSSSKSGGNKAGIVIGVLAILVVLLGLAMLFGTQAGRAFIRRNFSGQGRSFDDDDRLMQMEEMGEMPMFENDHGNKKTVY